MATLGSAERLFDIVGRTPAVLTSTASIVKGLNTIGVELSTLATMVNDGESKEAVTNFIDKQVAESVSVKGVSQDLALYQAEILKFAYTYAGSALGQSNQGLSDTDFKQAIEIINQGGTAETFLTNLHSRVKDAISATDIVINNFRDNRAIQLLGELDTSGTLMGGLMRPSKEYAAANNKGDIFNWGNTEYVHGTTLTGEVVVTPQQEDRTGWPTGAKRITQAMIDRYPKIDLAQYLGKIMYKNPETGTNDEYIPTERK